MEQHDINLAGAKILIVDDKPASIGEIETSLEGKGYQVFGARNGQEALTQANRIKPDLILLDVVLPYKGQLYGGFEVCRQLKANEGQKNIPVIFMTGFDEPDSVEGFNSGGIDYIHKPLRGSDVVARVEAHLKIARLTQALLQKNQELEQEIAKRQQAEEALDIADEQIAIISQRETERWGIPGFIGKSETIRQILDNVHRLHGAGTTSVLISGETGTGKELIARAIHFGGTRAKGPFIPVNCSAIPSELAESAFFGHVAGAFTGAKPKKGYFELANGGTLFLDEISDMPLELQPKLLRVLEDGCVTLVGGTQEKHINVRIIAATNADLQEKMTAGLFRGDLYFRLARFTFTVLPLRERREDIPLLASHFLKMFATEMNRVDATLSPQVLSVLMDYPFPGNVRELKNIIEHALILSRGEPIQPEHLHLQFPLSSGSSGNETKRYPTDLDSVQEFIKACCEVIPEAEIHTPTLFNQYQDFCQENGYVPEKRNRFYGRVRQLCPKIEQTLMGENRLAGLRGLRLKKASRGTERY